MLTVAGNHYLFDCGDSIASALWNDSDISLNRLHGVLFSHRHADHMGGLPALVLLLHQRIKNSRTDQPGHGTRRVLPPSCDTGVCFCVPGEQEQIDLLLDLMDMMHMPPALLAYTANIVPFTGAGPIYQDQWIQVEAFPTFHAIDSAGFVVSVAGKTILYSGDIQSPAVVAEIVKSSYCDVVIIENAHFPTLAITDALAGIPMGALIVTHRRDAIIANEGQARADLAPLAMHCPVLLAEDGMSHIVSPEE
jgi:hypothetical protein